MKIQLITGNKEINGSYTDGEKIKNIINATAYRLDYKECFPNREAPISVIFEPTKTTIGGIAYLADFHFANLFGNSGCKDKRL